ncbi:hypothetical protein GCM10027020_32680 [Nocardioides salsibiostraticola]
MNATEPEPRSKEEIEADLAETRDHLAETVDALGHKLDVKSRSRDKAVELKENHGRELLLGGVALVVVLVGLRVWKAKRR